MAADHGGGGPPKRSTPGSASGQAADRLKASVGTEQRQDSYWVPSRQLKPSLRGLRAARRFLAPRR
jgi:hypothetical protein